MAKRAKKQEEQNVVSDVSVEQIVAESAEILSEATVSDAVAETVAKSDKSELIRIHHDAICALNFRVQQSRIEYEDAKAEAGAAKRRHESMQEQLNALISQGPNPQRELAFPEHTEEVKASEAWKDVAISEAIVLTSKQAEKLEAAGVKTIGQFEHLRSGQMEGYPDGLRSVKGVGEKTVDEWENQIVEWLSVNAREPEPATEGTDDVGVIEEED
jgi:DNA uptake protein ComE-like DNA-binding protein